MFISQHCVIDAAMDWWMPPDRAGYIRRSIWGASTTRAYHSVEDSVHSDLWASTDLPREKYDIRKGKEKREKMYAHFPPLSSTIFLFLWEEDVFTEDEFLSFSFFCGGQKKSRVPLLGYTQRSSNNTCSSKTRPNVYTYGHRLRRSVCSRPHTQTDLAENEKNAS